MADIDTLQDTDTFILILLDLDWEHSPRCESALTPDCPETATHIIRCSCGCPPRYLGPRHVARMLAGDETHTAYGAPWRCPICMAAPVTVKLTPIGG